LTGSGIWSAIWRSSVSGPDEAARVIPYRGAPLELGEEELLVAGLLQTGCFEPGME
jgi:hypothetical protein